MPSDLDLVERLRTDPAPAMRVDLAQVTAVGRRRLRRRALRLAAVLTAAAVAAVIAVVAAMSSDDSHTTTPPAETSTTATDAGSPDLSITGTGTARLADKHGSYLLHLRGGTLTVQVAGGDPRRHPVSGVVLPSGATWVQVTGTEGSPVLVGVVPAGGRDIDLVPGPAGMAAHTVQTGPAGDFTAFVVRFHEPPAGHSLTAVDLRWAQDGATHRALGTAPQRAEFDVDEAGHLAVAMSSAVLRETMVTGTLDGVPLTPARLLGDTPDSAYSIQLHPLPGGRTLVWGVVPQPTVAMRLNLKFGASEGPPVNRPLGQRPSFLAYAVVVDGSPADVTGISTSDRSGAGIGTTH